MPTGTTASTSATETAQTYKKGLHLVSSYSISTNTTHIHIYSSPPKTTYFTMDTFSSVDIILTSDMSNETEFTFEDSERGGSGVGSYCVVA
jgi:hypothetical protein